MTATSAHSPPKQQPAKVAPRPSQPAAPPTSEELRDDLGQLQKEEKDRLDRKQTEELARLRDIQSLD